MNTLVPASRSWLRRALFQVHLWIGIAAGLYVFVLCVTGAALVFRIEMQRALHPDLFMSAEGPPADPATILERIRDAFPDDRISFVEAPSRVRPTWLAYLRRGNEFPAVLVDPVDARVLGEMPEHSAVRTLQGLHFDLLGGPRGRIVNGAGAALLAALCITGIVIWWPGLARWQRGFTIDRRRGWKRLIRDLHAAVGVWSVSLILMWAVTGLYFVFPSQIRAVVNAVSPLTVAQSPLSGPGPEDGTRISWRELIGRARQHRPGEHVARMVPPADPTAAFVVMFSASMPLPAGRATLTPVFLDQYTGARLEAPPSERSIGDVIVDWAGWLHVGGFGGFGGSVVRGAWLVLGLAPPLLFLTGFTMWWTRVVRPRWSAASVARRRERQGSAATRPGTATRS